MKSRCSWHPSFQKPLRQVANIKPWDSLPAFWKPVGKKLGREAKVTTGLGEMPEKRQPVVYAACFSDANVTNEMGTGKRL